MQTGLRTLSSQSVRSAAERAAAYVRMSTDHQKYSIAYQMTAIKGFAAARGIVLTKTFEDAGKSGLDLAGRPGLQGLLAEVLTGCAEFSSIIVYDVSRWGRFQDVDEAAYYEHLCRRSGVRVLYCAEPFPEDGGPLTAVIKSVKRAMAGEYSRELSARVTSGLLQRARLGYNQGGGCTYGFRRVIFDHDHRRIGILKPGQRKLFTDTHVKLEPGAQTEIRIVRWVFRMYVKEHRSASEVAALLNARGVRSPFGRSWYHGTIAYMLSNEKYIGTQIYNRSTQRLKTRRQANPPGLWIRVPGAFKGIVDPRLFWKAQEIRRQRSEPKPSELLLSELQACVRRHGIVPGRRFAKLGLSCARTYSDRFGSVQNAYALIGIAELPGHMLFDDQHGRRLQRRRILDEIEVGIRAAGQHVISAKIARAFTVDRNLRGWFDLVKARTTASGALQWRVWFRNQDRTDLYLLARIDLDDRVIDFYVIPRDALAVRSVILYLHNGQQFDQFKVPDVAAVCAGLAAAAFQS